MPYIYRNITLSLSENEENLSMALASLLGVEPEALKNLRVIRKGLDARKKTAIKQVYTVSFDLSVECRQFLHSKAKSGAFPEWHNEVETPPFPIVVEKKRRVIAGSGPAALFAALRLAEYGLSANIVERGEPVEQRTLDVRRFWKLGVLNPESNVQFGEGGAGTFSDGKLTCRTKDPLAAWVLDKFVQFGASPETRYLARPHLGTDRLTAIVKAIREHLIARGFSFRFGCRLTDMTIHNGAVTSAIINNSEEIPCDQLLIATGHSARDVYEMLARHRAPMEQKPFAAGVRIEHPQELIDRIQYGKKHEAVLPPADYALTWNDTATGRSAYSFCMCPGGVVIAGASEPGGVVTNGMSMEKRNSRYANSAIVVNVRTADFDSVDPLAGINFQRRLEELAFKAGGENYSAPAENLLSFIRHPGKKNIFSTYRPGITETDLEAVLPDFITVTLREAIQHFGKKMNGFVTSDATLIGVESRTSSPVRVLRHQDFQSTGIKGVYPAGEGAGYSGGIMSSAIDGARIADMIAMQEK